MNERECRDIVHQRSGGDCEIRIAGVCLGRATNFQHRLAKKHGGRFLPSNGLDVCGHGNLSGCHGYIHQNPKLAVERGWTVPSWGDPATTPAEVWMWGHMQAAALLDDAGDYHLHREP